MDALKEIELRRVGWSPELEHVLSMIDLCDPHVSLRFYRDEINAGNLFAFGAFAGGELCAGAVWKIEQGDAGRELVIIEAAGHLPGVDLVAAILPVWEGVARGMQCETVRFQTRRRGLARKMCAAGYEPAAVVMRKALQ